VYLARAFRRAYGCSITEYVQRHRIRRAAALIADRRLPLTQAAYAAGFADQSHLCRSFRRHAGVTPSAFRALAA
jgi:AraC family transcriptional regulator